MQIFKDSNTESVYDGILPSFTDYGFNGEDWQMKVLEHEIRRADKGLVQKLSISLCSKGSSDRQEHCQYSAHFFIPSPQISAPPIKTSPASKDNAPCAETGAAPGKGKILICS